MTITVNLKRWCGFKTCSKSLVGEIFFIFLTNMHIIFPCNLICCTEAIIFTICCWKEMKWGIFFGDNIEVYRQVVVMFRANIKKKTSRKTVFFKIYVDCKKNFSLCRGKKVSFLQHMLALAKYRQNLSLYNFRAGKPLWSGFLGHRASSQRGSKPVLFLVLFISFHLITRCTLSQLKWEPSVSKAGSVAEVGQ